MKEKNEFFTAKMLNVCDLTRKVKIIYFNALKIISSYFFKNSSSIILLLFCAIIDKIETVERKIEKEQN